MLDPILLSIAKNAILSRFSAEYLPDREEILKNFPFLNKDGASFVTLNYDNSLRGCIGSIVSHRILYDDIVNNAISAAFNDPRFTPLDSSELSHLNLEVSVLSRPEIVEYKDYDDLVKKVRPNIDGLILKHGSYQGTFLPQVWSQLPTSKEFLEHLSMKAGANPSIYKENPTIYRYSVDSIEKSFEEI